MKINLGVVFGGMSVEHEVSIVSALQGIGASDKEKYNIVPIYIAKDGKMYTGKNLLEIENFKDLNEVIRNAKQITFVKDRNVKLVKYPLSKFANNILGEVDVFLPIVHGTNCEDGSLQGIFENLDIPYGGCDVVSSAVGMDKTVMKKVLRCDKIPVTKGIDFDKRTWILNKDAIISKIESIEDFKYPLIIKPANLGSSVGVNKAENKLDLIKYVELAFEFSKKVLVEVCVRNLREINCAVLGNYKDAISSICEEPILQSGVLDYNQKYNSGSKSAKSSKSSGMASAQRKVPADIPKDLEEKIRQLAVNTFKSLGCSGVSRIDFLLDDETKNVYVNEINTIPGSLSFYLWEKTNITFKELIDRLVDIAVMNHKEKKELIFTYEENILANGDFSGVKGTKGAKI